MALDIQGTRLKKADSPDRALLPRKSAPPRDPFVLGHLPKRWDFDDTLGRFLPQLSTITFAPGTQGCRALGAGPDGRPLLDTSAVVAHFTGPKKRGVIIDPSDYRLGKYADYQLRVQNDANADINFSIWEGYDIVGGEVWWKHNAEEFRAFRVLCLEQKILPKIHPAVRDRAIKMQQSIIADLQKRFGRHPSHDGLRSELDMALGRLRAMQDAIPTADAIVLMRTEARAAKALEVDGPTLNATAPMLDPGADAEYQEFLAFKAMKAEAADRAAKDERNAKAREKRKADKGATP